MDLIQDKLNETYNYYLYTLTFSGELRSSVSFQPLTLRDNEEVVTNTQANDLQPPPKGTVFFMVPPADAFLPHPHPTNTPMLPGPWGVCP